MKTCLIALKIQVTETKKNDRCHFSLKEVKNHNSNIQLRNLNPGSYLEIKAYCKSQMQKLSVNKWY